MDEERGIIGNGFSLLITLGRLLGWHFSGCVHIHIEMKCKIEKKKERSFEKGKRMIIIHTSSFSVARLYFLLKKRKMKFMRLGNIKSQE